MPITAILQRIDGSSRVKSVMDANGGLNRCLPFGDPDVAPDQSIVQSFPLLQRVDPYCDVVFNHSQMPQLVQELELLMNRASDQSCRILLERVRELAVLCQDSNQLQLRFFGD
jgi:hypothetical protein